MQTNNITEMKMFFGIVILLPFLVTNPLIYSFTLKVFLFENSNRTLNFDSWYKKNEWSSNSFVIKNLSKFYVAAIKKDVYEQFVETIINETTFLSVNKKELRKDMLAIDRIVTLLQEIDES